MKLRKMKIFLVLAVLAWMVTACSSVTPTSDPPFVPTVTIDQISTAQSGLPRTEAEVPRVGLEETLKALESGSAIVVDVRSAEAYEASHIAGAVSIPLSKIETSPTQLALDKDQWIITYCT